MCCAKMSLYSTYVSEVSPSPQASVLSVFELLNREEKHDGQLRGFHLSLTAWLRLTPFHTGDRWCISTVVVCVFVCALFQ